MTRRRPRCGATAIRQQWAQAVLHPGFTRPGSGRLGLPEGSVVVRKVHKSGGGSGGYRRPGDAPFRGRRYPLEMIMRAAGVDSAGRLAQLVGVPAERVRQWKRRGLSFSQADELCCRLGLHVSAVEPDYFDDGFPLSV